MACTSTLLAVSTDGRAPPQNEPRHFRAEVPFRASPCAAPDHIRDVAHHKPTRVAIRVRNTRVGCVICKSEHMSGCILSLAHVLRSTEIAPVVQNSLLEYTNHFWSTNIAPLVQKSLLEYRNISWSAKVDSVVLNSLLEYPNRSCSTEIASVVQNSLL